MYSTTPNTVSVKLTRTRFFLHCPPLPQWCRIVHSCNVHRCHIVPICPLLHFPHPHFWPCRFVHSRKFHQPIRNRFRIQRFSVFDWRNWNRFHKSIETWSGDGFANETGNCARVYVESFVVIVAEITTKSNIHIFYKNYIKVLWWMYRKLWSTTIFTRATLCVERVIAVATCPSGCLAVCHSRYRVLYENGNS